MSKKIHPGMTYPEYMQEICAPLKQLGITYFGHVQIDAKGNFASINNNPDFHAYYITNKFYNNDIFMAKEDRFSSFVIWDNVPQSGKSRALYQEGYEFGLRHTFTIIESSASVKDYYYFATKKYNDGMNQSYINQLPLIHLFILHFKDKIKNNKVLQHAYEIKYRLDNEAGGYETKNDYPEIHKDEIEVFASSFKINKLFFQNIVEKNGLTKREFEVLVWLNRGKTVVEIATILALSEATINTYILSLKAKFEVRTLFQLGALFALSCPYPTLISGALKNKVS